MSFLPRQLKKKDWNKFPLYSRKPPTRKKNMPNVSSNFLKEEMWK